MSKELQKQVVTFYKFHADPTNHQKRATLKTFCDKQKLVGTILLADEGVNATVCGSPEAIAQLKTFLRSFLGWEDLHFKDSFVDAHQRPFYRMKIKLKKEIVSLKRAVNPVKEVGTYIKPKDWNDLLSKDDIVLLDTRNHYEYLTGTFKGAINPRTTTFSEFPNYVANNLDKTNNKKVAMFCTGGIRCEKASSFLLQQGFEEVYHLEGGILQYLEETPADQSLWEGECFVFDNRVTVRHGLQQGSYQECHACRMPISKKDQKSEFYQEGYACPYCYNKLSENQIKRFKERQKQVDLAQKRGHLHLGAKQVKNKKSKIHLTYL